MSMNIDKPLDEIISTKKASGRGRNKRGGGAPRPAGGAPAAPAAQGGKRAPAGNANGQAAASSQIPVGDKIVVSNLPDDVTEAQVKELFTSTVGPLRSASLAYDSKGHSKGVATVQFLKAADATKAYQQYNKRLVDGKRPMKVEIIVDPSRVPPAPLTSRLGALPASASATAAAAGGSARQARPGASTGGRGGGRSASGRGGRGGREKRPERPKATVESLDQEMSDYLSNAGTKEATA